MTTFYIQMQKYIKFGIKNVLLIVKCLFITPWCPANKLEWYKVIILSANTSGIANTVTSLLGLDTILNNNKSSDIYFSASA